MAKAPISGKHVVSYKAEVEEYAESNRSMDSFTGGAGAD
uniref:Uncharacterized protein n=1 Tax=Arundo donax TaxID=35708 RepID=A0A0A8ZJE4_ARUDO